MGPGNPAKSVHPLTSYMITGFLQDGPGNPAKFCASCNFIHDYRIFAGWFW